MTTNSALDALVWDVCETPLGPFTLEASAHGLAAISFPGRGGPRRWDRRDPITLDLSSTPFDLAVWTALLDIPYGQTASYGEVARAVGRPDIVRGVAAAIGRNPVPVVVPCHRVIGADGSLTSYRGGLQRKQALLDLERRVTAGLDPEPAWAFRQLALI